MTDWPIDPVRLGAGKGYRRQRVLIEAEVFDDPDPEDDEPGGRFYTFAITNGAPGNAADSGRELVSIREDHVRNVARRIPEPPAEPTMVPAHLLKGFGVEVFGAWRRVLDVRDARGGDVTIHLEGADCLTIQAPAHMPIPARLPQEATS